MCGKKTISHLIICAALALAACGGGGGSSEKTSNNASSASSSSQASTLLSGVATTGAAMTGSIQVTDAKLKQKKVSISANGHYQIDVRDLTPPFILQAKGTINNGQEASYYAPATAEDIGQRQINITPLSDLILANIAGDLAENCANHVDCIGALSKAKVDAAVSNLTAKLAPTLEEMKLDSTLDLLHTSFSPAAPEGISAFLDVLDITINIDTKVATIRNLASGTFIKDDLKTNSDDANPISEKTAESLTPSPQLIAKTKARWQQLISVFASPQTATQKKGLLKEFCTSDFKWGGMSCTEFIDYLEPKDGAQDNPIPFAITRIAAFDVNAVDSINPRESMTTQNIGMLLEDDYRQRIPLLWKQATNGQLYLSGDQKISQIFISAYQQLYAATKLIDAGLSVDIRPEKTINGNSLIDLVTMTGPGLPEEGVDFVSSADDQFVIASLGYAFLSLSNPKYVPYPSKIENNLAYTFTLKQGGVAKASYKVSLVNAPLQVTALTASLFPSIRNLPTLALCQDGGTWMPEYLLPENYQMLDITAACTGDTNTLKAELNYRSGAKLSSAITLSATPASKFLFLDYGALDANGRQFWVNSQSMRR